MNGFIDPHILDYAAVILTLVVLEGLLSADNALVLAVMVRHLPGEQQGRALRYGIIGAFVFRAIGVLLATFLIKLWYLKALGGAYLLYLAGAHFWQHFKAHGAAEGLAARTRGFWATVAAVELTDIAFSVDSIVAAVGLSSNKWIVYLGGVLGIIAMRFVAQTFIKIINRFPGLESSAYLIVAWIGLKLVLEAMDQRANPEVYLAAASGHGPQPHIIPPWVFWSVLGAIFGGAFLFKNKNAAKDLGVRESAAAAVHDRECS